MGNVLDLLNLEGKVSVQPIRAVVAEMLVGHSGLLIAERWMTVGDRCRRS
jgi:hypothetical protein